MNNTLITQLIFDALNRLAHDLIHRTTIEAPAEATSVAFSGEPANSPITLRISNGDCGNQNRTMCAVAHEVAVIRDTIEQGAENYGRFESVEQWQQEIAKHFKSGERLASKRRIDSAAIASLEQAGFESATAFYIQWLEHRLSEVEGQDEFDELTRELYAQRIEALKQKGRNQLKSSE